ncbi:ABC transporter permease [Zophobihabitans entericus]|uniref:ABC transporter permease n=1 Tax=Zophobihabitans entericus TaxID=1635327 RepID=A0A6G9ICC2_9GAMM|nr:ABC transporter permease [Zophobihabitans entericus]QIQ21487.1 ABC transporter permease [Zophobihabitans entericus]
MSLSIRRLQALCVKETKQIIRDPSSMLIAIVIPVLLLLIFSYGINLDSSRLNVGVVVQDESLPAQRFVQVLQGSDYLNPVVASHREVLDDQLKMGNIRSIIIIPNDFGKQFTDNQASIQVITDGSEPNIANFVQAYMQGVWRIWQQQNLQDAGQELTSSIEVEMRYWFNAAATSRHFIIPGAITIIMTVICSILTSLVIAREWERGTMEGLLSTPMTKWELLLSKLLPYYGLGLFAMLICLLFSIFIIHVPYRGSFIALFILSSLFLFTVLGMGLLISTLTRNQFNAAMIAINAAFLPAVMLSGFVFEISSMPVIIRLTTYIIPARYFVNSLQTLFLSGDVVSVLITNGIFLAVFTLILLTLVMRTTKLHLDR